MPSLDGRGHEHGYWRSLDELAGTDEFRALLQAEFPHPVAGEWASTSRRGFLKAIGASLAFAGLVGCRWPKETIVPYAKRPPGRKPGVPVPFATAFELSGVGTGVLATSFDGRPIKIEGNPLHPFSLGRSNAWMQAAILELYDPDRSRQPSKRTPTGRNNIDWNQFEAETRELLQSHRATGGQNLCVLTQTSSSPSLTAMRKRFEAAFPQAQWFEYEPLSRDNVRQGTALAFGQPHRPVLDLAKARVIVSFDDDILLTHPAAVRYARDFAQHRVADDGHMNRLYVIESTLSLTGSNADVRITARPSEIPQRMFQLLRALVDAGLELPAAGQALAAKLAQTGLPAPSAEITDIAKNLLQETGHVAICVGPNQPPAAHALAALLNQLLDSAGTVVHYALEPDPQRPTHLEAIARLSERLRNAQGATAIILGGNPVYDAPADFNFTELFGLRDSIHLSLYRNETSQACKWHVPAAHWLEAWSDVRAWDGTVSIAQPLIAPLYDGKSALEFLAWLIGDEPMSGYEIVRQTFAQSAATDDHLEEHWQIALHDGVVAESAWELVAPTIEPAQWPTVLDQAIAAAQQKPPQNGQTPPLEVAFTADRKVYDGRFANNGWLQELPDPITKLTWDNAALLAPADAELLGVERGDMLEFAVDKRTLSIPAFPLPGHPAGVVTLPLGYGRTAGGRVAEDVGFDVYALRSRQRTAGGWVEVVRRANRKHELVTTQDHHAMKSEVGERETQKRIGQLVREGTLLEYNNDPQFVKHRAHSQPLEQPFGAQEFPDKPHWAMAIDLSKCTGCSACVVACQAENNIPVVGKDEVAVGREMQWMRIDRYFAGDPHEADALKVAHQPVACQHCENAPCEQVCPVGATVHDEEGLNVMVYNRCIGTRYCSNNCPYKVRRFNWFWNHHGPSHPYSDGVTDQEKITEIEKMAFNPEVTVRSRGVMEKCTFCTQRIAAAKIDAKNEGRPVADGEIVPACAQSCPSNAIVFGDLNDPSSEVSKLHRHARAYPLLEYLNIRPRNIYLARLRNPLHDPGPQQHDAPAHGGHDAAHS